MEGSPSDHKPLLLVPEMINTGQKRRQFKFENAWLTDPMCSHIIKGCWEDEVTSDVLQKIRNCANSLEIWGREITSCFSKLIKSCKTKLRLLRNKRDDRSVAEYEEAKT